MSESDSDYNESDEELQEALAAGVLRPGLNEVAEAPKKFPNDIVGLRRALNLIKLNLPWIERLDLINEPAALAPELAAQIHEQEQRHESKLKNNKKLPQISIEDDPVLNDFKRETLFYRQAQAAVVVGIEKLKNVGVLTKRPEDYFAEMAKSDNQMQKIRDNLSKQQHMRERMEKISKLRQQRKEGKALQQQTALKRQQEKKDMLEQIKIVRKGKGGDLSFLDNKKKTNNGKAKSGVGVRKGKNKDRKWRDEKFGFGGRKKGSKKNTRESTTNVDNWKKGPVRGKANQRPGKSKRVRNNNKKK